jgi:hypothetical protein
LCLCLYLKVFESIWKATVVFKLAIYWVHYHSPVCIYSQILYVQLDLIPGAHILRYWNKWIF